MRVLQLWRFPVKSMQGEQLTSADVGDHGLAGDRSWALQDRSTGLTLTARREPRLLFAEGRLSPDGSAFVRLPDGTETDDEERLSAWLGRDVALAAADPLTAGTYEIALDAEDEASSEWVTWSGPVGSFHDSTRTKVSMIGEDSLRHWSVRRFRANLIVAGGDEDSLVGRSVRSDQGMVLDVVKRIDRCVMVTREQPGGIERDPGVLRTINRERATFLGVGALVRHGGRLSVGDELYDDQEGSG